MAKLICMCGDADTEHENSGLGLRDTACRRCKECGAFSVDLSRSTIDPVVDTEEAQA